MEDKFLKLKEALQMYSWGKQETYDVVGTFHLLKACLNNMIEHQKEISIDELQSCFTEEQRIYINKIVSSLNIS